MKIQFKLIPFLIEVYIQINCKSPYKIQGAIIIKPDSILISGSERDLNNIHKWDVKPVIFENVNKKINTMISLEDSYLINDFDKVNLQVDIDKFTEAIINVPIKLINQPEKLNAKINPESLDLKYLVTFKNYKKVSENDFQIICDWTDLSPSKKEIKIKEIKGPNYVTIINEKSIKKQTVSIWINKN